MTHYNGNVSYTVPVRHMDLALRIVLKRLGDERLMDTFTAKELAQLRTVCHVTAECVTTSLVARALWQRARYAEIKDGGGFPRAFVSSVLENRTEDTVALIRGARLAHVIDEETNYNGQSVTPLIFVAGRIWSSVELLEKLLKAGADPNHLCRGKTALSVVCSGPISSLEDNQGLKLKLLLKAGALSDATETSALVQLLQAGSDILEVVELLLNAGADVNRDSGDGTVLKVAASFGDMTPNGDAVVRMFLDRGADINLQDRDGQTPLFRAVCAGNVTFIQTAFEYGANFDIQDNFGKTALFLIADICDNPRTPDVARLLIKCGASIAVRDVENNTPLLDVINDSWINARNYDFIFETVEVLLHGGADVNAQNDQGTTPLMIAARRNTLRLVHLLLRYGANSTLKDIEGRTALAVAGRHVRLAMTGETSTMLQSTVWIR